MRRPVAPDNIGDTDTEQEHTDGSSAIFTAKPVGKIQDDTGVQPRLCRPKQQAHDIERGGAGDEGHTCGNHTPGEHDAGDPESGPTRAMIRLLGISMVE